MSLLRSRSVGAVLLAAMVAACADQNDSPVAPPDAFSVTGVNPASGSVAGGNEVGVDGSGFREGTTVTFGGVPAARVHVVSSRVLYVIAPPHDLGDVQIVVTNPDGWSASPPSLYHYVDNTPGPWDY